MTEKISNNRGKTGPKKQNKFELKAGKHRDLGLGLKETTEEQIGGMPEFRSA
ncbi:hypothetical protein [Paenibacillus monticola]|uniref:Uncharacterized protein n=1 Tax=Paenibacillus monticola TaxID=2666075 RepID=A0A7X2HBG3_9BACL|nr:hypothetical protein [Paenibacillus monticola]MRN57049.1 hypothetical protein [Paenibacillus monticola]